jgi:F-type H+-transporting ATPase subunit delta
MPRPTTAARRYAEAAFELAQRDGGFDQWDEDLRLAAELLADERVASIVRSPAVPYPQREAILQRLLEDRLSRPAYNLLRLLAQRRRLELIAQIAAEYGRLLDRQNGVVAATVTSAAPLDNTETAAVQSRLEEMSGQAVRLTPVVDPALIGGLTVRVGDRLIDASVRGRLERLREQLVAGSR